MISRDWASVSPKIMLSIWQVFLIVNISLHVNNCFKESELNRNAVIKEYLTTAFDYSISLTRHRMFLFNPFKERFRISDRYVFVIF